MRSSSSVRQLVLGQVGERGVGDALERLQAQAGVALLGVQVRVVDGERAVGGELEQLLVVGVNSRGSGCRRAGRRGPAPDQQRAPSSERMPFSRRIGLRMSAWSTSGISIARRSATIRPANPRPTGARPARPPPRPLGRARQHLAVAPAAGSPPCRVQDLRDAASSAARASSDRWASAASVTRWATRAGCSPPIKPRMVPTRTIDWIMGLEAHAAPARAGDRAGSGYVPAVPCLGGMAGGHLGPALPRTIAALIAGRAGRVRRVAAAGGADRRPLPEAFFVTWACRVAIICLIAYLDGGTSPAPDAVPDAVFAARRTRSVDGRVCPACGVLGLLGGRPRGSADPARLGLPREMALSGVLACGSRAWASHEWQLSRPPPAVTRRRSSGGACPHPARPQRLHRHEPRGGGLLRGRSTLALLRSSDPRPLGGRVAALPGLRGAVVAALAERMAPASPAPA